MPGAAPAGGRAPAGPAALACWAAGLATRTLPDATAVGDWEALHEFAVRERCAALAWLRSGDVIRAHAPVAVAERWRATHLTVATRGHAQLALTAPIAAELARRGVRVVWIKGAPLAARLYGEATARASTDVDWLVTAPERAAASAVLREAGWTRIEGDDAGDDAWTAPSPHGPMYVEVHSSLLHPRFAYLPVPAPESELVEVEGFALHAHAGALLPGYLAAHLATHPFPPLLWQLDFAALWDALDAGERATALAAARRAGLARYLAWALRRRERIARVAEGDRRAAAGLGYHDARRSEPHPMWRHIALAPSPAAAWRAAMGWAFPPWVGAEHGGVVRGTARRAARHWRAALGTAPATTAAPEAPVARVDEGRLLAIVRAAVGAGGEAWIAVTGQSMQPTLAPGDRVLLAPPAGAPRRGEIVLADASGRPLLHRVAAVGADGVRLRGDACATDDPPLPPSAIVARAVAVSRGGSVAALRPTLRFGGAALARWSAQRARGLAAAAARGAAGAP